jgi:NAD(P)H-dependent FMN reductase
MIVGSLRKQSFNRQLAQFAAHALAGRANVSVLDWRDVPVFNQDEEFPNPESVSAARAAVAGADALWIVTPEYNHGMPGPLKNLLDWLSRPAEDGAPSPLFGKTMTMSGAGGANCVRDSFATLLPVLEFMQMRFAPVTFTGIALSREMFVSNTLELDDAAKTAIEHQADALIGMVTER